MTIENKELDKAELRALGKFEQLAADRLKHRRRLGQCLLHVAGCELP
jgi:hypothetical protein